MATPDPSQTAPSPQASPPKPKALIVISSGRTLPLAQPSGHPGISTGFFLVELAKVLQDFGDDYDLVFATPDGERPQLDINGMALNFHAVAGLGPATARAAVAQAARFDVGYQVDTATNPAAVRVVYDEKAKLLTGNGPQAIDDQAAKLRQLLDGAKQGMPATAGAPA